MASKNVMKNVREQIIFFIIFTIALKVVEGEYTFLYNTEGNISSPGFPNSYPHNYNYIWKIRVSEKYRIKLVFDSFNLEPCNNCACDYVAIYDLDGSHLDKICGQTVTSFVSEFEGLDVKFKTDGSATRSGFSATYTTELKIKRIIPPRIERDLTQYFLNTKQQQVLTTNKRSTDITKAAVALFLSDARFFTPGNETGEEIAYELTLQLMSKLVMKKLISTKDLAAFVNAMMVTCINPTNFFGLNVVAELRKRIDRNNQTNPFLLLALCIGGGNTSTQDVEKLQQLFYADSRPSWTGTQAMVVMALECISRKSQVNLKTVLVQMTLKLKEKQQNNGTVENLKTTALVIQALVATGNYKTNFNISMAIKSILKENMHKHLSSETLYYILPILQWKTLLDINSTHCEKFIKTELEETKKQTTEHPDTDIHVQISVIIGDDMDFSRTWRIKVPSNYSFYHVMENISFSDPDYKVQYTILGGKPFVVGLNKYEDSIENGLFWFIYKKPVTTNRDLVLVEKSPLDIQVNETNEIILWYRLGPLPSTQEISTDVPFTITTAKSLAYTTDVTFTEPWDYATEDRNFSL